MNSYDTVMWLITIVGFALLGGLLRGFHSLVPSWFCYAIYSLLVGGALRIGYVRYPDPHYLSGLVYLMIGVGVISWLSYLSWDHSRAILRYPVFVLAGLFITVKGKMDKMAEVAKRRS